MPRGPDAARWRRRSRFVPPTRPDEGRTDPSLLPHRARPVSRSGGEALQLFPHESAMTSGTQSPTMRHWIPLPGTTPSPAGSKEISWFAAPTPMWRSPTSPCSTSCSAISTRTDLDAVALDRRHQRRRDDVPPADRPDRAVRGRTRSARRRRRHPGRRALPEHPGLRDGLPRHPPRRAPPRRRSTRSTRPTRSPTSSPTPRPTG